jgi:hypothetical protein
MKILGLNAGRIFFGGLFSLLLVSAAAGQNMFRKVNDFDGDGKADFVVTRNINGLKYWYIWQSANQSGVVQFGLSTDQNYAGDYDGDGKWDVGVYRQSPGSIPNNTAHSFWFRKSQTGAVDVVLFEIFNGSFYAPFQQDYDGDGLTDIAVHITNIASNFQSIFIIRESSTGTSRSLGPVIDSLSTPVQAGDMTGDGKADLVTYSRSTFDVSIVNSADSTTQTVRFGAQGDQYLAADFDGDAKGDLTVFRQADGSWWWLRSSDNVVNAATFGRTGDVPVPADYDGDGKTDIAIYRAGAQGYYWVYGSQIGVFALPWGVSGDTVVRY